MAGEGAAVCCARSAALGTHGLKVRPRPAGPLGSPPRESAPRPSFGLEAPPGPGAEGGARDDQQLGAGKDAGRLDQSLNLAVA